MMVREDVNDRQEYTLSAPKLTVNLNGSATDMEHVTGSGGVVQLATAKRRDGKVLGFTKLKCLRFDFDNREQLITAKGPGLIAVDNSKLAEPKRKKKGHSFGLRRQCYAIIKDFESLKYSLETGLLSTSSGTNKINIGYVPVGKDDEEPTNVTAGHIDAKIIETADGVSELSQLKASQGVTYSDGSREFVGSEFLYKADEAKITATGNEVWPCLLNGTTVAGIIYDLKRNRIKTRVIGPGQLQIK